jgi:hypothetical protein
MLTAASRCHDRLRWDLVTQGLKSSQTLVRAILGVEVDHQEVFAGEEADVRVWVLAPLGSKDMDVVRRQ